MLNGSVQRCRCRCRTTDEAIYGAARGIATAIAMKMPTNAQLEIDS